MQIDCKCKYKLRKKHCKSEITKYFVGLKFYGYA
jgi:hypothetical protein